MHAVSGSRMHEQLQSDALYSVLTMCHTTGSDTKILQWLGLFRESNQWLVFRNSAVTCSFKIKNLFWRSFRDLMSGAIPSS